MNPHDRAKKPEPERTQPIRDWWTVFGAPGATPPPPSQQAPCADSVSRGVEMGYRVIDEYLRQGQSVARALWAPSLGGTPSQDELQQRMGMMFRSFSDFMGLWLELLGRSTPQRGPATGSAGPFTVGTEAGPPGFSLALESARRVEVSVDLRPGSPDRPLKVLDLRAPEPDSPPLTEVSLETEPSGNRVRVRLRIPDAAAAGVYSGIILDARTGLPHGTLCVRILPT